MFFQYISCPLPSYITVNELEKAYQVQQQTNEEAKKGNRMKWTPELKEVFQKAVEKLGLDGINLYPNLMLL